MLLLYTDRCDRGPLATSVDGSRARWPRIAARKHKRQAVSPHAPIIAHYAAVSYFVSTCQRRRWQSFVGWEIVGDAIVFGRVRRLDYHPDPAGGTAVGVRGGGRSLILGRTPGDKGASWHVNCVTKIDNASYVARWRTVD